MLGRAALGVKIDIFFLEKILHWGFWTKKINFFDELIL